MEHRQLERLKGLLLEWYRALAIVAGMLVLGSLLMSVVRMGWYDTLPFWVVAELRALAHGLWSVGLMCLGWSLVSILGVCGIEMYLEHHYDG